MCGQHSAKQAQDLPDARVHSHSIKVPVHFAGSCGLLITESNSSIQREVQTAAVTCSM
jgi:hypothetical protein